MIRIYIDNEEVVCDKNIEIKEEFLATSSTILKNCYPKSWENNHDYVNNFYFPKDYSKCLIYNDDTLIFCGVVKNTGNISLNPRMPHYCDLQVLDFKTFLSEGETLDFVITEKTVSEAINMVVEAVSQYGFVVGNIQTTTADDTIGAYSTLNKTAYDVLQYLADITQCRWFTRMVDENTVAIDFYDSDLMIEQDDIEYTQNYFEENNIQDVSFSYSTGDYRNKQIMLSDEIYGSIDYNETILADGYNKNYLTSANIGVLKAISVNGVPKTIATTDDRDLGIVADFYYAVSSNSIESDELYSAGSQIDLSYTPLVKGRQIVINDEEINRVGNQTGRNGIISRYERRNDSLSNDELNSIGQSYLKYKGKAEVVLKVLTYNKDLYNIGNLVYFNAPLDDLKMQYMVKKKTTQIIANTGDIFYTYELSSSFNSESDINYFDNQRAKASGNIQSGEYITRNIDIENSALIIFNNLSITEVSAGNILNGALNMTLDN